MTMDLENDHIKDLIKSYRSALRRYYDDDPETIKCMEESTDYTIAVDMMYDAISYRDHMMKAKILYNKYNNRKKEDHKH